MYKCNKKVAILVPTLRFGGGERVATNIINGLSHYSGLDLSVILYDNQIDYEINDNVKIISLHEKTDIKLFFKKSISFIRKIIKLKKELKKNEITHIISIMPSMNIISLLASGNTFNIISEHNVISKSKSPVNFITNLLKKITYKNANKIVCVSNGVSDSLKKLIPGLESKVIYNPLDINHIRELSGEKLDFNIAKYILGVGRLHEQKGFDLLIRALAMLDSDVHLVILGDGSEKDSLVNLSKDLKIHDKIHILGFQQNPYNFMRHAQAFVLSSRWEGFGLVLAEALVTNTKTVSFNCKSGPAEILNYGELGLLVKPDNSAELAKAIQTILDNKIQFSREKIDERLKEFDINYVVEKYFNLINT